LSSDIVTLSKAKNRSFNHLPDDFSECFSLKILLFSPDYFFVADKRLLRIKKAGQNTRPFGFCLY